MFDREWPRLIFSMLSLNLERSLSLSVRSFLTILSDWLASETDGELIFNRTLDLKWLSVY